MSLPSAQRDILDTLEQLKHDKWGFVIYRCTYKDDDGWLRFKEILHEYTRKSMQRSDAPEAADSLDWTFVEDQGALDRASRSQLRERFNQWAAHAFMIEQPRAQAHTHPNPTFGVPRYNYFIQVDEEALQSVLTAPKRDLHGQAFVNFVDSQWEPMPREKYGGEEENVFHPVDGCTQENVGWMRVALRMINAEFYDAAAEFAGGVWYVYYKRPPEILTQ
jgi:hypothetical protein